MTILHTSDWHLGHLLYGFSRDAEQRDMLQQLKQIVEARKPDALLVSGDVFHTGTPSASVQQLFVEAIVALHNANPGMCIIITAGNHDSASKHVVFRTPWRAMNVHTIGTFDSNNPADIIIEIPGKGFVIAMPYVNERFLPADTFANLLAAVAERNVDGLPVVLMAHTAVAGCDFAGHDSVDARTVGGIDCCPLDMLGSGYDYVALGHIHKPQHVAGANGRVYYCGSPLPVSFDETAPHGVAWVSIDAHGMQPVVEPIPISNLMPLETLPASGAAPWDDVVQMLRDFPADRNAYIRLQVEVDNFLSPNANYEAMALLEGKKARLCVINTVRKAVAKGEAKGLTVSQLRQESPEGLLQRFAADKGFSLDDELIAMFRSVLRSLNE